MQWPPCYKMNAGSFNQIMHKKNMLPHFTHHPIGMYSTQVTHSIHSPLTLLLLLLSLASLSLTLSNCSCVLLSFSSVSYSLLRIARVGNTIFLAVSIVCKTIGETNESIMSRTTIAVEKTLVCACSVVLTWVTPLVHHSNQPFEEESFSDAGSSCSIGQAVSFDFVSSLACSLRRLLSSWRREAITCFFLRRELGIVGLSPHTRTHRLHLQNEFPTQ